MIQSRFMRLPPVRCRDYNADGGETVASVRTLCLRTPTGGDMDLLFIVLVVVLVLALLGFFGRSYW
jgi:hypothetical protein